MAERHSKVDQSLRDQIFKIACRIIEKILICECNKHNPQTLKVDQIAQQKACLRIVTNLIFIKSVLIYAI